MDDRVADTTSATDSAFPADSRLEGVRLGTVEKLDVVEDDLALAPRSIGFEVVSGEDLATPAISVFSLNLDVSRQENDFCSHVNSIVGACS